MNPDSLNTETRVYMSPEEVQSLIAAAKIRERALAIRTMWWAAARSKTVATWFYRRNHQMQDGEIPMSSSRSKTRIQTTTDQHRLPGVSSRTPSGRISNSGVTTTAESQPISPLRARKQIYK